VGGANESQLELVAVEVGPPDFLVRILTVAMGLDVTATRQDEPVDAIQDLFDLMIGNGNQRDGETAGAEHRVGVGMPDEV
jgi:hypothetical protein